MRRIVSGLFQNGCYLWGKQTGKSAAIGNANDKKPVSWYSFLNIEFGETQLRLKSSRRGYGPLL